MAKVTDTPLGTIRSLENTVQGLGERGQTWASTLAEVEKRAKDLEARIGAPFDHEDRHKELAKRQQAIEEQLDLTKNQAPSRAETEAVEGIQQSTDEFRETTRGVARERKASQRI